MPTDQDLYIRACYIQESMIMEYDEELIDSIFEELKRRRDNGELTIG
jgi:hypothetical protein